jgi:3-methylfumaryl-CoA hydratase
LTFGQPLRLGERVTKCSTIRSITPKEGKNGRLCFVIVEHELLVDGQRRLLEEQTIVYREPVSANGDGAAAPPAPSVSDFSATYHPNPLMLFRYSALTFNSHRIHYDVDFCRQHEGYPDLVVHGPLTATLLLDLFYRHFPHKRIASFSYRGVSPLFNPDPFTVHGTADGQAWASNVNGGLAMSAQVEMVEGGGENGR